MKAATLTDAERACASLRQRLAGEDCVQGIGIAVLDGGYGVKLNLREKPTFDLPAEVNGVPVLAEIVGTITAW